MPRILVLYGTTEGQTAKIARFVGDVLREGGAEADVIDARTASPAPDAYGAVIVAASIHAGGFQRPVARWVEAHAGELNAKPTAFIAVCLSVLQREPKVQEELTSIVERFLTRAAWHPPMTKCVAGALPYTRYNWIKRWIMVRIVRRAGGDIDTSRDYEYTDWAEVRAFAEQFARVARTEHARVA